jgi:hypothetical protein
MFSSTQSEIVSSETVVEYAAQIATDNEISGTMPVEWLPFPLEAEANINAMGSFEFQQYRFDKFIKSQFASLTPKRLNRHEELLPEVKQILLEAPLETIHSKLGDFYATKIEVGGVFQLTVATDLVGAASELGMSIGGTIDAHIASASLGVSGSVETNVRGQKSRTRLTVLGGNSKVWLKLNENNPAAAIQEEWAQSITTANEYPIGFTLVPIWDLLNHDDMNIMKAADLKNYMTTKWHEANQQLPAYPPAPDPPDNCKDNVNIHGSDWWVTCMLPNMHSVRRRRQHCQCDTGYEPDGPFKCSRCKDPSP